MKLKVQIMTPSGLVKLQHEVDPNEDVDKLKEAIQDKAGTEPDNQRFIAFGAQLDGGRTWTDYNIQEGALIHVVLKKPADAAK
mmetsp:Transcript_66319/g.137588  ORF Transcript_66319/g.137588 Transcript_66319/m.137588 type:complete len:83 (-) Transcript_66319:233-481(-)